MRKVICYFLVSMSLIAHFSDAWGADTDIYVLDQTIQQVPPDILIVLDLSGSMLWTPAGETMYIDRGNYTKTGYQYSCGDDVPYYATTSFSYTNLGTCTINAYGTVPKYSDASCSGPFYRSARTIGGVQYTTDCSRVEIAKRAIRSILDANNDGLVNSQDETTLSMRMGYMRFYACTRNTGSNPDNGTNYNAGCNQLIHSIGTSYSDIWNTICNAGASGGTHLANSLREAKKYLDDHKSGDNAKNCRKKFVIFISDGADTLVCNGTGSETQSDQYKRRRESVARARELANAGYKVFIVGFGADLPIFLKNTLNWAAYYGGTDNQSVPNASSGVYDIPSGQIFPQGVSSCSDSPTVCKVLSDYLVDPANARDCKLTGSNQTPVDNRYYYATSNDPGQIDISGYAYFAESPAQLEQALTDIKDYILNLLAESSSYVAPVVPISQMQNYESMNRMYLAMFKPTLNSLWLGNIKKFGIADTPSGTVKIGDIIDVNNNKAITTMYEIEKNARSYWSTTNDGGEVVRGGVGERLALRNLIANPRNIYTYVGLPNKKLLTETENAFTVDNSNITYSKLGISADPTKRERIIRFAHGYDSYDWDENGIRDEKRKGSFINDSGQEVKVDWILGAFIHSRPLIIHYPNKSVIYAGANDGMFHAFVDSTGEELWAFIPPSLLPKLKDFETNNTLQIFVDGSPKAYIEKNLSGTITKAIIIFGLRRGGDRYIALDVTNPDAPRLLWEIAPSTSSSPLLGHEITAGFERLGQTWSTPVLKQVADGNEKRVVAFFAGGYDPCNDPNMNCGSSDQKGNAVFAIDVETGQLLWSFSKAQNPAMTYSIPSDIAALDINGDGKVDRLYVGDMGGQLWRFDIGNLNNTNAWTGKVIFKANQTSAEKRKMFYPPDVSPGSGFEWVFIGTGDRENPKQETGTVSFPTRNRLYAIKDSNPSSPLTETNLVDVTDNILQKPNPNAAEIILQNQTLQNLNNLNGWFITLENKGEKCLASPLIHSGVVYYTTFTPSYPNEGDICFLGEGTGRVYALQYKTGMAIHNYDLTNDIEGQPPTIFKTDRSLIIGAGIPTQIVLAIIKGEIQGYIGIGGGVRDESNLDPKSIKVLYWRTVN